MTASVRPALTLTVCAFLGGPALAQDAPCRQALALGLDVSASVDAREYRLQLDGLAAALGTPGVRAALLARPDAPAELLVYEWSGVDDQQLLLDWTAIRSEADIRIVQETLGQVRRREATPGTALGPAMRAGAAHLARRAGCRTRTLDISGDGKANAGIRPAAVKGEMAAAGITVNALVIGADAASYGDLRQADIAELSSYFRVNVITGPDAFVQIALGYDDYARAMARKLERELQGVVVSSLSPFRDRP